MSKCIHPSKYAKNKRKHRVNCLTIAKLIIKVNTKVLNKISMLNLFQILHRILHYPLSNHDVDRHLKHKYIDLKCLPIFKWYR